ncbi:VOC family protein [uncultured Roseibium sp.]|uniref:VOC family protein n=1 Tax=uncultured Roseibium sp. TaxID=1936171 RepID=UPI00260BC5D2|nr:VOC family protein [uncultured Roseibium sp.]
MSTILGSATVEHIMIGTGNYDATLAWWTEKLGFEVEMEWTVPEFSGLQLAYLTKNGFRLEIVGNPARFQERPAPMAIDQHLADSGFSHLAFKVEDVDAVMAELSEKGVPTFLPATSFADVGRRVAFVQDNQGNVIEFAADLPREAA